MQLASESTSNRKRVEEVPSKLLFPPLRYLLEVELALNSLSNQQRQMYYRCMERYLPTLILLCCPFSYGIINPPLMSVIK